MSRLRWGLGLAVLLIAGQPAAAAEVFGTWKSPKNSVHLDIRPCGQQACGFVIWASPGADADARKGSGKPLVGQQLLRDFRPDKAGWRGKVYAPDLNRTFTGTAKLLDDDRLEAKGCVLGGLICKTQIWQRVRS
jgi:uncharacterized protein (DUF2147 family)